MLDLENEVDPVPVTKYEVFDSILQDAKQKVTFNPDVHEHEFRRRQVLNALRQIDDVLADHNVIYPPGDWILTLAEGLQPHTLTEADAKAALAHNHTQKRIDHIKNYKGKTFYYMDCDILSFMYMSIGELIGLDLHLVDCPTHNFVRYAFSETDYIDWETTGPEETTDKLYRMIYPNITSTNIEERVYLATMTPDETLGYFFSLRGARCEKLTPPNYQQAEADYKTAMHLYPQAAGPHNALAWIYVAAPGLWHGLSDMPIELALRAVSIQPHDSEFLDTLATTYAAARDFDKAIMFEQDAIDHFSVEDPAAQGDRAKFQTRLQAFNSHKTYIEIGGDPVNDKPTSGPSTPDQG
jgi:tetratricopeptide (TPR) repeat protein